MARDQHEDDAVGRLAERILSTSGTMVGVCATLIGLVKLTESRRGLSHVDEYAGITAVAFVLSALLSYLALRTRSTSKWRGRLEAAADTVFLGALGALALIGVMFAFDLV